MIVALWIAVMVLAAMTILLALVVSGLMHAMNELRMVDAAIASFRPKGLPVGATAPELSGTTADGSWFDAGLLAGRSHLAVFVSPDCAPCEPLLRELSDGSRTRRLPPTVLVSRRPSREDDPTWVRLTENPDVILLTETEDELAGRFQTHTTPHVFVVDQAGTIRAQGVANSVEAIMEMVGGEVPAS
jgi:hypothetical protein